MNQFDERHTKFARTDRTPGSFTDDRISIKRFMEIVVYTVAVIIWVWVAIRFIILG